MDNDTLSVLTSMVIASHSSLSCLPAYRPAEARSNGKSSCQPGPESSVRLGRSRGESWAVGLLVYRQRLGVEDRSVAAVAASISMVTPAKRRTAQSQAAGEGDAPPPPVVGSAAGLTGTTPGVGLAGGVVAGVAAGAAVGVAVGDGAGVAAGAGVGVAVAEAVAVAVAKGAGVAVGVGVGVGLGVRAAAGVDGRVSVDVGVTASVSLTTGSPAAWSNWRGLARMREPMPATSLVSPLGQRGQMAIVSPTAKPLVSSTSSSVEPAAAAAVREVPAALSA